jgi:hypothetical protein
VQSRRLHRDFALGVVVGDLDADGGVVAQALHVGGGAGVHDGVGDELAGEDDRVVDDVGEAPAVQGVADEGAGDRDRTPHRFEGGRCSRRDHRAPHCSLLVSALFVSARGGPAPAWCRPGAVRAPPALVPEGARVGGRATRARLLTRGHGVCAGCRGFHREDGVRGARGSPDPG